MMQDGTQVVGVIIDWKEFETKNHQDNFELLQWVRKDLKNAGFHCNGNGMRAGCGIKFL